jgi:hypothetical protein
VPHHQCGSRLPEPKALDCVRLAAALGRPGMRIQAILAVTDLRWKRLGGFESEGGGKPHALQGASRSAAML